MYSIGLRVRCVYFQGSVSSGKRSRLGRVAWLSRGNSQLLEELKRVQDH